jgi:probable aminopeptidase NPEPL1
MASFLQNSSVSFRFGSLPLAEESDSTLLLTRCCNASPSLTHEAFLRLLGFSDDSSSTTISAMIESIGGSSGTATTFVKTTKPGHYHQVHIGLLPYTVSRNNHPFSVHTITEIVANKINWNSKSDRLGVTNHRIIIIGDSQYTAKQSMGALVSAIAKAFPVYSRKTGNNDDQHQSIIHVSFSDLPSGDDGALELWDVDATICTAICEGVRLAGWLVDQTPEELTTTAYSQICKDVMANELKDQMVTYTEIVGSELESRGYGGLWGVGKAAVCPPLLVSLEYRPPNDQNNPEDAEKSSKLETIALVGKGIVYDTGGLAIKPREGMCGMKIDMGGSAGLLGAFYAAVKMRIPKRITLLLCLAENAVGPNAFRNDDILTLYSGKTVEINNTDAEGRLVLGDGVAHATKHIDGLDLVIDMATLTGAQLIATGKKHASILANTVDLEQRAMQAGLRSGDLTFPLLYAPDLLRKEFDSKVADMKNSVKDRMNAQASCAGHFIEAHLDKEYSGGWLHVDMSGPAAKDERGTGYGVGLVLALLEAPGF